MSASARIGLGTVQFGLDYGATNRPGKVSEANAAAILKLALDAGIDTLDTAPAYGDGEAVLGRAIPAGLQPRIVTKTPPLSDCATAEDAAARLEASFAQSLEALRRPRIAGLLAHRALDLLGPHGQALWDAMARFKAQGRVDRIGASVYDGAEIDALLDRYPIDLIQLPFNALDQRLLECGQIDALARAGVEVHARSLFLQGVLLAPLDRLPAHCAPLLGPIAALDQAFAEAGLNRLEGLLSVGFQQPAIGRLICGATSMDELGAILAAADRAAAAPPVSLPRFEISEELLNPTKWPAQA